MSLELRNVSFRYKKSDRPVLDNISMTFCESKLNVVVGLSGAGKTTLFDLIAGALPRPEGFHGVPSDDRIVYQLQSVPVHSTLKGKDLVRLLLNTDHRRTTPVRRPIRLEDMDERECALMDHLWNMRLGAMSVGERRWLLTTSICAMDRDLYIFDEPTSNVDPDSRMRLLSRLQRLARRPNALVIMSTHILHELQFVDCVMFLLHNGQLLFSGSYKEFLQLGHSENPDIAFQTLIGSKLQFSPRSGLEVVQ
jgi:ABC-2 type transport system ATP-binding protein